MVESPLTRSKVTPSRGCSWAMPTLWTTASTLRRRSRQVCGEKRSALVHSTSSIQRPEASSGRPLRETLRTSWPAAIARRQIARPMNPLPPTTRSRVIRPDRVGRYVGVVVDRVGDTALVTAYMPDGDGTLRDGRRRDAQRRAATGRSETGGDGTLRDGRQRDAQRRSTPVSGSPTVSALSRSAAAVADDSVSSVAARSALIAARIATPNRTNPSIRAAVTIHGLGVGASPSY